VQATTMSKSAGELRNMWCSLAYFVGWLAYTVQA